MKILTVIIVGFFSFSCMEHDLLKVPDPRSSKEKKKSEDASQGNDGAPGDYFIINEILLTNHDDLKPDDILSLQEEESILYEIDQDSMGLGVTKELLYSRFIPTEKEVEFECEDQTYSPLVPHFKQVISHLT